MMKTALKRLIKSRVISENTDNAFYHTAKLFFGSGGRRPGPECECARHHWGSSWGGAAGGHAMAAYAMAAWGPWGTGSGGLLLMLLLLPSSCCCSRPYLLLKSHSAYSGLLHCVAYTRPAVSLSSQWSSSPKGPKGPHCNPPAPSIMGTLRHIYFANLKPNL